MNLHTLCLYVEMWSLEGQVALAGPFWPILSKKWRDSPKKYPSFWHHFPIVSTSWTMMIYIASKNSLVPLIKSRKIPLEPWTPTVFQCDEISMWWNMTRKPSKSTLLASRVFQVWNQIAQLPPLQSHIWAHFLQTWSALWIDNSWHEVQDHPKMKEG